MKTLQEGMVKARRRILRKVDLSKPAVVMDVYDAFNQLVDAGLTSAFYAGSWSFSDILCRLIVGDMGQHRGNITATRRWDGRTISVNSINVKEEQLRYNHLENLNKVYVYTDYAPRKEGSKQYYGADQPEVVVDLHRFLDDSKRTTYRDRFIVLDGYSTSAEFYSPEGGRGVLRLSPHALLEPRCTVGRKRRGRRDLLQQFPPDKSLRRSRGSGFRRHTALGQTAKTIITSRVQRVFAKISANLPLGSQLTEC